MAEGRDFAPGGVLHNLLGEDGCSDTADSILNSTFNTDVLREQKRDNLETLLTLIKHMERPRDKDGNLVKDTEWSYGMDEYHASFSKKSEETSCGPSGLHMSHWIAACEDNELCALHAKFIEAAFQIGLPYE